MRSQPTGGWLLLACSLLGPTPAGAGVLPPDPGDPAGAIRSRVEADAPLNRLPIARLALAEAASVSPEPAPPWGGPISRVEGDAPEPNPAFATMDCGRVRPESATRRNVSPKPTAGKAFGDANWMALGLIGLLIGIGGLAAELARPPKFGLVPYGRRRQASS